MNRRDMLKTIVGVAAVGVVAPKVVQAASTAPACFISPCPPTPRPLPPKDMRTPEEVWRDETERQAQSIFAPCANNPYYRYTSYVTPEVYARLLELQVEHHHEVQTVTLYGRTGLVINGNVILAFV
jgi:hypothetical protein